MQENFPESDSCLFLLFLCGISYTTEKKIKITDVAEDHSFNVELSILELT